MASISGGSIKIGHYAVSQSKFGNQKCGLCFDSLQEIGVGHTFGKVNDLFHKVCFFKWREKGNVFCPSCQKNIWEPKGSSSFQYLFPRFIAQYPNNKENLQLAGERISRMYAFFLTKQAHEKDEVNELRKLGIDVMLFFPDHQYAFLEKVESFVQNLTDIITSEDGEEKGSLYLETTWSPEEGPLRRALKQSAFETDGFQWCFPYYTQSSIAISEDWIILDVRLNSSLSCEKVEDQRPQLRLQI